MQSDVANRKKKENKKQIKKKCKPFFQIPYVKNKIYCTNPVTLQLNECSEVNSDKFVHLIMYQQTSDKYFRHK